MKMIMLLMMAMDGASSSAPDVQLLDFSAGYCGPCQQMVPMLQRMEHAGFPIRQIEITEDPELTKRFNVDRIPTLVLLVEGREVRRFVGLTSEDELRQAMHKAAATLKEKRTAELDSAQLQFASQATQRTVPSDAPAAEKAPPAGRPEIVKTAEKRSLGDVFRRMIGKEADNPTTLRGQDPATNEQSLDWTKTAHAATVRIRVAGKSTEDGAYLQDVGTGTIVHSVTGQAIVLTCAHLFLNISVKEAVVEVEVFENGNPVTYPAKLIGGDHDADLALLRIRTTKIFPSMPIRSRVSDPKAGQAMISFGCNDGADPTRLDTKLVDINRYDGPPNFVCTIDPVSGRSGGGLFGSSGELMGVCSCADRKTHEGLYAAHGAMLELVNYCELKDILRPSDSNDSRTVGDVAVGEDPAESFKEQMTNPSPGETSPKAPAAKPAIAKAPLPSASEFNFMETDDAAVSTPDALLELPDAVPSGSSGRSRSLAQPVVVSTSAPTGPEITIMIDDKSGAEPKRIVIPQASAWMLEMLTGESPGTESAVTTALRPVHAVAPQRR